MPNNQKIYFAQRGKDGPIKIGLSINPKKRIEELKTGSSERLRILYTKPGTIKEEHLFHKLFENYRIDREWFEPAPEILAYIDNLCRRIPKPSEDDILWSPKDLAQFLNVKLGTIYSWLSRKRPLPPYIKIEGSTRWRESVVRRWVEIKEQQKKESNFEV